MNELESYIENMERILKKAKEEKDLEFALCCEFAVKSAIKHLDMIKGDKNET
jgi:hypothetical protein